MEIMYRNVRTYFLKKMMNLKCMNNLSPAAVMIFALNMPTKQFIIIYSTKKVKEIVFEGL